MNNRAVSANWSYPTDIRFGVGRATELYEVCHELGVSKPLLITDLNLIEKGMIVDQISVLEEQDISPGTFYDIKATPDESVINSGINVFTKGKYDAIIAIGGGCVIDCAKAIAFMIYQSVTEWNGGVQFTPKDVGDKIPLIVVPTTAGTGSEVNANFVIASEQSKQKHFIASAHTIPMVVIADPELHVDLPQHYTAATGMHALTNNLEAYCVEEYNPFLEGICLEGIRLCKENLPAAYHGGVDIDARSQLMIASMMGGLAQQKGLGAIHVLAQALGSHFDIHHGLLKGIILPYVLTFNRQAIEAKMAHVAHYIGLVSPLFSALFDWCLDLRSELKIPHTLRSLGIGEDCVAAVVEQAVMDPAVEKNPIPLSEESLRAICTSAITGEL